MNNSASRPDHRWDHFSHCQIFVPQKSLSHSSHNDHNDEEQKKQPNGYDYTCHCGCVLKCPSFFLIKLTDSLRRSCEKGRRRAAPFFSFSRGKTLVSSCFTFALFPGMSFTCDPDFFLQLQSRKNLFTFPFYRPNGGGEKSLLTHVGLFLRKEAEGNEGKSLSLFFSSLSAFLRCTQRRRKVSFFSRKGGEGKSLFFRHHRPFFRARKSGREEVSFYARGGPLFTQRSGRKSLSFPVSTPSAFFRVRKGGRRGEKVSRRGTGEEEEVSFGLRHP